MFLNVNWFKLRTVGIFAISQLVRELYAKEEFLFLTVFEQCKAFFTFFAFENMPKII